VQRRLVDLVELQLAAAAARLDVVYWAHYGQTTSQKRRRGRRRKRCRRRRRRGMRRRGRGGGGGRGGRGVSEV
jgi:hypothetical protein